MQDKFQFVQGPSRLIEKTFPPDIPVTETLNTTKHSAKTLASLLNCIDFK